MARVSVKRKKEAKFRRDSKRALLLVVLGLFQVHTQHWRFLLPLLGAIRQSQVVWGEEYVEAKRFRIGSLHGRCHTWAEWEEKMLVDGNFMDEFRLDKSALQELLGSIDLPEWAVVGRRRCPRTNVITFKGFRVYKVEMLLLVLYKLHRPVTNSQAGVFFCMSDPCVRCVLCPGVCAFCMLSFTAF